MGSNKEKIIPWIQAGYETFGLQGPDFLKVERLAAEVGKSKSSFYHHFADLQIFTAALLETHLSQTRIISEKEKNCQSAEELIEIFMEHKTDLLFNRQLRIHRENEVFAACFEASNEIAIPNFLRIWSRIIGLEANSHLAGLVLQLTIENFYLRITPESLNPPFLRDYFRGLQELVREFKKTGQVPTLDGSV